MNKQPHAARSPLLSREEAKVFKKDPEKLREYVLDGIKYGQYMSRVDGTMFSLMEYDEVPR
jgi:hypothetical protein